MKLTAVVKSTRAASWYGLIIALTVFTACSSDSKRDDSYLNAKTMPELQIPDDLHRPDENRRALVEVPEQLDTEKEIPEGLELPPKVAGINIEEESAKTEVDSGEDAAEDNEKLDSKIVFQSDNTQLLAVKADIDTVWPRVEEAIKEIGFKVEDSNRGKFYFTIVREFERVQTVQDPSKPIEMDLEKPKEEHMIYVEPGEEYIEITVRNLQSKVEGTVLANQLLLQIKGYIE